MLRIRQYIARFAKDQEGIAYLEFALTMPILLMLMLGAIEVTRYIIIIQKVEKVSVTISDLVAQSEDITTEELDILIQAAGQVMQPYSLDDNGYVVITSVTKTGSNPALVNWQYTGAGDWVQSSLLGTPGSSANLPEGFTMDSGENAIFTEVFFRFTPLLGSVAGNAVGINSVYKRAVFRPRLGDLTVLGWIHPVQKGAFV